MTDEHSNGNGNGSGRPVESPERKYLTGKITADEYNDELEREAEEGAEQSLALTIKEKEAALA